MVRRHIEAAVVGLFLLAACDKAPPPKEMCQRVTLLHVDPSKNVLMPHWHIRPGDILVLRDDKVVMTFPSGQQFALPVKDAEIKNEECR